MECDVVAISCFSYYSVKSEEGMQLAKLGSIFITFYLGLVHFSVIYFFSLSEIKTTCVYGSISLIIIFFLWKKVLNNKWEDFELKKGDN